MNTFLTLSSAQLNRAAAIKEKITSLEEELAALLGTTEHIGKMGTKRGMSGTGRAKVAAAQKARWAKVRAVKKN